MFCNQNQARNQLCNCCVTMQWLAQVQTEGRDVVGSYKSMYGGKVCSMLGYNIGGC